MHIKLSNQFFTSIFTSQNGKRNILRVQYFMSEDIGLYIKSPKQTWITECTLKGRKNCNVLFFLPVFQAIKSANVLSLLLIYLDFLLLTDSQKQITLLPRDQEEKNPLIAFKLICLYCSTQERADRGRKKSGKSIMPLCLPPATIRLTPTLPLRSGSARAQFTGQPEQPARAQTPH